ncbi:MAG: helix-turn-helix transcriptional regulator [Pseudomonadota bacterium]
MRMLSLSDKAIAELLGERIKALRLRRNITQEALAQATALSLNTIKALESGKGKLATVIAVLRELDALDQLDNFIPPPTISPLQLAKRQGKQRARASGSRALPASDEDEAPW